ncbi:MAG: FAD-dependent oxidoreductase, partial [Candidatus Dormibacteraeota bacterium]|nr:FAD-dependent oxidoreductase [Candidatus Dormibacteraeota bacterium]
DLALEKIMLPVAGAEVRTGTPVSALHVEAHQVELESGERIGYDRVLLATGAHPRTLPDYRDAIYLRWIRDADRIRKLLAGEGRIEIIGAGFIGCEVAAAGRQRGHEVTVYEALAQPLLRVLGPVLGEMVAELHRDRGVELLTGVDELPEPREDFVVGVGTLPNQDLARAAGIQCEGGILVDELGRTSAPDVYAAGDCARFWSPALESRIRVEHFQTAQRHGRAVGRNLATPDAVEPFTQWPWFWTDQYDQEIQYLGAGVPWDGLRFRGDVERPPLVAFQLQGERVVGVVAWNEGRAMTQIRRILERRVQVTVDQLCDPDTDLRALARG